MHGNRPNPPLPRSHQKLVLGLFFLWCTFLVNPLRAQDTAQPASAGKDLSVNLAGTSSVDIRNVSSAQSTGFYTITLDFDNLGGGGLIPKDYYASQGLYLEPFAFWGGPNADDCNNNGPGSAYFLDGSAFMNLPAGFTSISMIYAAAGVQPGCTGTYASGFRVFSGQNGSGSLLYQFFFSGHLDNGQPNQGGCTYNVWPETGVVSFLGETARSIEFWETPYPCPGEDSGPYTFTSLDTIEFGIHVPSNSFVVDAPITFGEFEVPEGSSSDFYVKLDQELFPGQTVDVVIERDSTIPNSLQLSENTHTFTHENWDQDWQVTVTAVENDGGDTGNDKTTYTIKAIDTPGNTEIESVEIKAEEIDDDFLLTIKAEIPVGGGSELGGHTEPHIESSFRDIDNSAAWALEVLAVPDPGYEVIDIDSRILGAAPPNFEFDREGDVVMASPEQLPDGSIRRRIENISLDPDGGTHVNIAAFFSDIPFVSVTFEVGNGMGTTNPAGAVSWEPDHDHTITAEPDTGYEFDYWRIVNGTATIGNTSSATTTLNPETDCVVEANFRQAQGTYTLSLGASPSQGGTTAPSGDVILGAGDALAIEATANEGWSFDRWQVSGPVTFVSGSATTPNAQVSIFGNSSLTAVFTQGNINLTVSAMPANGGSVTPNGTVSLNSGSVQAISAFPNTGWAFNGWQTTGPVTFTSGSESTPSAEVRADGNSTVTALFSEVGVSGQVVVSPATLTVDEGGAQKVFTISMDGPPTELLSLQLRTIDAPNSLIRINGEQWITYNFAFLPNDWQTIHTFNVQALEDTNERNGYTELRLIQDSLSSDVQTQTYYIEENDSSSLDRIKITPSQITVTEGENSCTQNVYFTVSLPHAPMQSNKTIWLETDTNTQYFYGLVGCGGSNVHNNTITFNSQNWQTGIKVAVDLPPGQREDVVETFYASERSGNPAYADSARVAIRMQNNPQGDHAQLIADQQSLIVPEGGEATLTLTLIDPPPEPITVITSFLGDSGAFSGSGNVTLSAQNPTKTVTINSHEDDSDIPNTGYIRFRYSGSYYNYIENLDVDLVEEDNDGSRPVAIAVPSSLTMEAGTVSQVLISLAQPPEVPTVLSLETNDTSGTPGLVIHSPGDRQLTFTPENYSAPQAVKVFADAEGNGNLAAAFQSGDDRTQGVTVPVTVTQASVRIQTDPTGLGFNSGSSQNFKVWLSARPNSDVTLQLTARDTDGFPGIGIDTPDPAILTFTQDNYSQEQTVRVSADNFGDGEVTVSWLSGDPQLPPVVLPVSINDNSCSGHVIVATPQIALKEGQTGIIEVSQTNNRNFSKILEVVQTLGDSGVIQFEETTFSVPNNGSYILHFSALHDIDLQDEALRFSIRDLTPSSPSCSLIDKSVFIDVTDVDYQLTLTANPAGEGLETLPPDGETALVDGTVYTADNPYQIAAFSGGQYVFDFWSGDTQVLANAPGNPFDNPIQNPFPVIVNSGPEYLRQVSLTANFREIEPDVEEQIDAIVDNLLAALETQCGLGGADFNEFGLESSNRTGTMGDGRILPHSGQELRDETDLTLPGLDHPTELKITRRHLTRVNAERSPFGPAWFFNYRIYFTRNGDGDILLHNLGRTDRFVKDPSLPDVWQGTGGRFGRIFREGPNTLVMRAPSGVKWEFLVYYESTNVLFKGVIQKIISPNGNHIRFEYEDGAIPLLDQRMTKMVDAFGRDIEFVYGPDGNSPYVTEIRDQTDPNAVRVWQYSYDAQGRLTSVRTPTVTTTGGFNDFPNGKRTNYLYRDHSDPRLTNALTGIVFPNQTSKNQTYQRYQWTYYDDDPADPLFGYVKTHTMGDPGAPYPLRSGGSFTYSYQPMVNEGGIGDVSMCTTVTDRAGIKTELDYNRRGLLLEERTENPSPSKNGPTQYKRAFTFNANGDLTSAKTPLQAAQDDGTATSEFHPDPAITPRHMQRQELRQVMAADLRGGDQVEIVTETRYEPIFNKVFSTVDPRGLGIDPEFNAEDVTTYQFYDYMENLTEAIAIYAPQLGLTEAELRGLFADAGIPQIIQEKWGVNPFDGVAIDINDDGRTFQDYCGNLIRRDFPDTILPDAAGTIGMPSLQKAFERYEYNQFGQMTRYVDAEGNHTVWTFFPYGDPNGWQGSPGSAEFEAGGGFPASKIEDQAHDAGANGGSGAQPAQRTISFAYLAQERFPRNAHGMATTITNGRGVVSRRFINELDQLTIYQTAWSVPGGDPDLEALGYQQRSRYDANGNVDQTSIRNLGSLNNTGSFFYNNTIFDLLDQPVREVRDAAAGGLALTTENVYDANQNLIRRVSAAGSPDQSVQEWTYDARDLLVSTTKGVDGDPAIGEVAAFTYEYDDNGNRIRSIDADGDITHFQYDGLDRLFRTQDRVGNVTLTQFDAASNPIGVEKYGSTGYVASTVLLSKSEKKRDARGRVYETLMHLFHYDGLSFGSLDPGANGTMTSAASALVRHETVFDRLSRPAGTIDADGDFYRKIYDGLGGLYRTIDPLGNSVVHLYDGNHNLIRLIEREKDPAGQLEDEVFITEFRYDAANRQYQVHEPNGQVTTKQFDARNNLVRLTDHLQNVTDYHYDALGRQIGEIRYLSDTGENAGPGSYSETITLATEWDDLSRVAAKIDDKGNRTEYAYDDLSRVISTEYPEGTTETSIYNGDGERTRFVNMAGTVLTWQYDAEGRPLEMAVDHSGTGEDFPFEGTTLKQWAYDGLNRQIYSYDDNGTRADTSLDNEAGTYHYFDSLSRPIAERQVFGQWEGGNPTANGKLTISEWQGDQRLAGLTYPDGRTVTRTYDALDRLSEVRESGGALIASFDYMGPGRDLQVTYGNGTALQKRDPAFPNTLGFGYDQNRRSLLHRWAKLSDGTVITAYRDTYNGIGGQGTNRVTGQYRDHLSRGDQWTLDARYRITEFERNDGTLSSSRLLDGTDAMDAEFIDEGFHQNPIPDWKTYDYFYFGSQPRPHDDNGNLRGDGFQEFTYDYANRLTTVRDIQSGQTIARYSYTADNRRVARMVDGVLTRYLYAGWQVVEERDGLDAVLRQYVDGRRLDEHLQMTGYTLSGNGSATPFYYHCNAQGFVGALTDDQGSVVEYAEYSLLGRPTLLDETGAPLPGNVSSVGNTYLFQGRRYDPETQRYYFRNRYYDPLTGHFTTLDPSGRWRHGQGNGYSAFAADPWNNHDPMGLETTVNSDCAQMLIYLSLLVNNPVTGNRYDPLRSYLNPMLGWLGTMDHLQLNQMLFNEASISTPELAGQYSQLRYGNLEMFGRNRFADFAIGLSTSNTSWSLPGNILGDPRYFNAGQLTGDLAFMSGASAIAAQANAPGPGSVAPGFANMQATAEMIRSRTTVQELIIHGPVSGMQGPRVNMYQPTRFEQMVLRAQTLYYRVRNFLFR